MEAPQSKPKASISLDNAGDAARQYMRSRTAKTCATFFLEYLKPGMALLDCGCGEGTISADLAEITAPGKLVGIDIAANALQHATQLADERGLSNVQFDEGSIYELPYPDNSFDAVFSHALFEHLTDKAAALREIRRVLRPGSFVGLRSPDMDATVLEPPDPILERFWDMFLRIRIELGGDNHTGRKLPGLLSLAGFSEVKGSASCETFGTRDRLKFYADIYGGLALKHPYVDEWLKRGWVVPEELEGIYIAFQEWALQPGAFTMHTYCEAIGWKS
jgi:SAM-dependent methyltransferase